MRLSFFLCTFCLSITSALAQLDLPWHLADAEGRTVYRISTSNEAHDLAVTLSGLSEATAPAFVEAASPDKLLPVYRNHQSVSFALPGRWAPAVPRFVIAYRGTPSRSPLLATPPASPDFAATVLKRSWDFEDGTPCGITSWGNSPNHLGTISVSNGWLRIPVKDTDPYLIFGDMFGPPESPRNLRIDSAAYRFLELRVRQSCPAAEWEFFLTDRDGTYKSLKFKVRGTDAQAFKFDLRSIFPDFWDGRLFRALRLDTINGQRDVVAEVDFIRLLPEPPTVAAGPSFSRDAIAVRSRISGFKPSLPRSLTAGTRNTARIKTAGVPRNSPVLWSFATPDSHVTIGGSAAGVPLPVLTRAGACAWTLGLADDLGEPLFPAAGTLQIKPAVLASYRLAPEKEFVDLSSPRVTLSITGLDAYGNPQPVAIKRPAWSSSGNAHFSCDRLEGYPASSTVTCPPDKPATWRITLTDENGHSGEAAVTTVAYRKDTVRLTASGYLVTSDGTHYFPAGGLYANWPHRPSPDGSVSRALDLFPCGPVPYLEGFPWSPQTEAAVKAYLSHCSLRGINCLRLMLRNMDLVGKVDPVQLRAALHLFDLARPHGIRFNVVLFEDYDKPPYVSTAILEQIVRPHYTTEELAALPAHRARFLVRKEALPSAALRYTDPDAIACQKDYLRELIPVLAAREEVLCYEFENEMVFPPMSWCSAIAAFIRMIDPHTLILGNPGPHDWPEPLRWRESGCDLFSFHPYNDGQPPADHGAVIYLRSKFAAQSGLALYTGEGGINQNRWQKGVKRVSPEASGRGARDQIWMSVCCGANGCLYWTLDHDQEAREFASIQPAFQALGLDFKTLKRQRPSVALALPARQRDHRDAALAMRLLDLGVDFDAVTTNEALAYASRILPGKQKPEDVTLPATVASPAKGWQIATLLAEKGDQALLYVRNVAGGVKDFGAPPRPCFIRDVQLAEASVTLHAPWRSVTVYDLDAREAQTVIPDASWRISLGVSSHDFLIALRR